MGAICGAVVTGKQGAADKIGEAMFGKLRAYRFDAEGALAEGSVYMGCGIVHHTPESRREQLPRKGAAGRYWITADAIIDNRAELLEALGLCPAEDEEPTDGELILKAYEVWGRDCPKRLIGDYAFAVWDDEKKELFCARDALGQRTLYYALEQGAFAFCTVEKPLLGALGGRVALNEKWIADFLAIDGIQHQMSCEETVYDGILQLLPGHSGVWDGRGLRIAKYWDPLREAAPIRYESDEQYVQAFRDIFAEAVACRTRSADEVGIMLSGGMDSGSIACVAAKQLQRERRRLMAYCSVPEKSFRENPGRFNVYDESREVDLLVRAYPNIAVQYCSFDGRNALDGIDELVDIFGQPYKVFQNMTWYYPMMRLAAKEGCKVLLNGQVGNSTISYGDFGVNLKTLLRRGKWGAAMREIRGLSRLHRVPIKKVLRPAVGLMIPYRLRRWKDRLREKGFDRFRNVIVRRSLIPKWDLEARLDQVNGNTQTPRYLDYEEDKELRVSPLHFTHIGAIETKLSLATGIAIRDPSRDRRLIEYCLSVPSEQYVRNGLDRFLLRRAMEGTLPDPIRNNLTKKGVQSADWLHRLKPNGEKLLTKLDEAIADRRIEEYIERQQVEEVRERLARFPDSIDETAVRMALVAIILRTFIQSFAREHKEEEWHHTA